MLRAAQEGISGLMYSRQAGAGKRWRSSKQTAQMQVQQQQCRCRAP
jgi:hypothetical protein